MQPNNITLYNFAGRGDVINSTSVIRLIKTRKPNCFVRVCCMERDKCFFENNPFIDELVCINNQSAISKAAYAMNTRSYNNLRYWGNEVNTWICADDTKIVNDFCWGSAAIVNKFFGEIVINYHDNLLPELFYTEKDQIKANEFIQEYSPYVVIETESFSGQYMAAKDFISLLLSRLQGIDVKIKVFTSAIKNPIYYPFYSLNNFNLKETGLILQGSECFYGIGSGMTVVAFERTLKDFKKIIDYQSSMDWYIRHGKTNVEKIQANTLTNRFCYDLLYTYK